MLEQVAISQMSDIGVGQLEGLVHGSIYPGNGGNKDPNRKLGQRASPLASGSEPPRRAGIGRVSPLALDRDILAVGQTERDELKRLRKQVRTLRMEREIQKKAASLFASESV